MSPFGTVSTAILDLILGALLPLLLPAMSRLRRDIALELLAAHGPQTTKELRFPAEAIAYSLRGLELLGQSNAAGASLDQRITAVTWACRLDRAGHQAQKRLDELQRARRQQRRGMPASEPAAFEPAAPESAASVPEMARRATEMGTAANVAAKATVASEKAASAAAQVPDVAQTEAALRTAEKLLGLMKSHWKGAPPPHTQAAQQIQTQERAVNLARMTLAQARRREAGTAKAATAA
ncbi:MAG: hypothetical protein ACJ8AW_36305 [Rhodopila sp.]